ncbi:MAG: Gfo/Idh/MocA family oxidoreductase [Armatimonadetes bacterium]|nr:Gfo/Idh/MocA family oxidoreductase [Armatimonadota bacterium]
MKRREFLAAAGTAGLSMLGGKLFASQQNAPLVRPARRKGKSMADFHAPKLDTVRFGFIGVGARGPTHINSVLACEGTEVVAICDLYQDWAERAAKRVTDAGFKKPDLYVDGERAFEKMCARDDIDAIVIATPWEWHVPMALCAMQHGKHAFVEVPAALTIEDCWKLVDTSEATQKHCMMMENVNYGREELLVLNMCRLGLFGDLLHGEAAYIHDLRGQMHEVERGTGSWRTVHYQKRNGNLYPTHGLGPVAQYMNINRGDRMDYMSSVSCKSMMRGIYGRVNFPDDHKWNKTPFVCGDINTSIVRTVMGRSMMIQWDEQLARPYTRHNYIQGTKGAWGGFPNRCTIEGISKSTDSWEQGGDLKHWFDDFEHPLYKKQGELATRVGGHGGMDFLMMWRIVYCLRNGLPLDQDVYDAASWSAVTPLSEWSVANRGQSIDFPDFTRGDWKNTKPVAIFDPDA